MTFKVDLSPVVDFFNSLPEYVQLVEWWHVYILVAFVLSFTVLPFRWKSVGGMLLSPVWLPVYALLQGGNYLGSFLKSLFGFRSNLLKLVQECKVLVSNIETECRNNRLLASNIGNNHSNALTRNHSDIVNLLTRFITSLNTGCVTTNTNVLSCLKRLEDLMSKCNVNGVKVTSYPSNQPIYVNASVPATPTVTLSKSVLESSGLPTTSSQPIANPQPVVNIADLQKIVNEQFKDIGSDKYLALGVLAPSSGENSYDFNYRLGIKVGALKQGKVTKADIHVPTGANFKSIYKIKYVTPNNLPMFEEVKKV